MSAQLEEKTVPSVTLPEYARDLREDPSAVRLKTESVRGPATPALGSSDLGTTNPSSPSAVPPSLQRGAWKQSASAGPRSFATPLPPRPSRPFAAGGVPPTVIRDLDAMFAADRARRSIEPPPMLAPAHVPGPPIEPAALAQALLDKVSRDFSTPAPRDGVERRDSSQARVRFVVQSGSLSAPAPLDIPTALIALPDDDEDLARLVPWHVRLWRRLFG